MGRHTLYTPELAAEICERISKGEPLEVICRDEGMPHAMKVHEWKSVDSRPKGVPATFAVDFARAREAGYDAIAADCFVIADDGTNDYMERLGVDGQGAGWALNGDHVQRSKLRIDTRLKLLAKWSKRYGDQLTLRGDAEAPLVTIVKDFSGIK